MSRRINRAGCEIIRESEGLRLKAYLCPANVLTVGYGSTGPHVREGQTITRDQAEALLVQDLRRFEDGVAQLCPIATDNQFSACVSFAFNIGLEAFRNSTLRSLHNQGKYREAALQFARWNKCKGKALPGLTKRRAREAKLYGDMA